MNEITIFKNDEFGQVRTTTDENGNVLLCLVDLCRALDLNPSKVAQRLDDDVLSKYPIRDIRGRQQVANFVNEDGFYDVLLESRKPSARKFRKWVTSEVLPAIRKTGSYNVAAPVDPVEGLKEVTNTFTEYIRSQQLVNQTMLEMMQALREDIREKKRALIESLPRTASYEHPATIVKISIVPAGVQCVTKFLDSRSVSYVRLGGLRGQYHELVVRDGVSEQLVRDLKDVIHNFTASSKWAKVEEIVI